MKRLLIVFSLCLVVLAFVPAAPAALNAGDIAIIAFNLTPDNYRCVTLIDLPANEVIRFTDNGWTNAQFRTGEGSVTWTNPSLMAAGTIFDAGIGSMTLSSAGDQVLGYQVAAGSTTFVYAVNCWDTAGVWQASATNSNSSGLPTGLTNGECAVALFNTSPGNWVFNTNIFSSGTRAQWLAAISEKTNWLASTTMPAGSITITGGSSLPDNPPTFGATVMSTSQIDLAWTKNTSNDDVMAAYATSNTFGSPSGTYIVGNLISGGGQVIYNGSGTAHSHTGLTPGGTYYYKAWSVHTGPAYSAGVTVSGTTPDPTYPGLTITNPTPPSVRVVNATSTINIEGFSSNLVGEIAWTNHATGIASTVPAATEWTISPVALNEGANLVGISATNGVGQAISASITIVRASPSVFNPGDLQIIGYRGTADDGMAFVTWVNLTEGQQIGLTDCGWTNTQFRFGEDFAAWTVPAGGLSAGTVAVFSFPDSGFGVVDVGSLTGKLNGISTSGDQLFLFTGTNTAPAFIYGIDFNGLNTNWDASATTANNSGLPPELNVYGYNMAVRFTNNFQYAGIRTGTVMELKAAVLETTNWISSGDGIGFVLDSTDFTITGGNPDADGDGMPDSWEMANFGTLTNGASGDNDEDTANNLEEYGADTNPTNSDSVLRFIRFDYPRPGVVPRFKGGIQAVQIIETTTNVLGGDWTLLTSNQPPTSVTNTFGVAPTAPREFYRVRAYR